MSASLSTEAELRSAVVDAMRPHLARGIAYAQMRAGDEIGMTARRVRAWWEQTIKTVPFREADRIRAWHRSWCRAEHVRLTQQLANLEQRIAAE